MNAPAVQADSACVSHDILRHGYADYLKSGGIHPAYCRNMMQGYFGGQRLGDASDLSLPQVFRYLYVFFYTVFNLRNLLYIIPAVHLSLPGAIYSGLSYQIFK